MFRISAGLICAALMSPASAQQIDVRQHVRMHIANYCTFIGRTAAIFYEVQRNPADHLPPVAASVLDQQMPLSRIGLYVAMEGIAANHAGDAQSLYREVVAGCHIAFEE